MKRYTALLSIIILSFYGTASGQLMTAQEKFSHADSLRGSLNPERTWWDVKKYDITVQPDYQAQTITGHNTITYKVIKESYPAFMQIDLQEPMEIDSVLFGNSKRILPFTREGNAFHIAVPKQRKNSIGTIEIIFHGKPRKAVKAPWDGGWIWTKDSLGRPWMSVACQGLGASVWYPCKDHQSDEPENGAIQTIIVPDTLTAVGNGRLVAVNALPDHLKSYKWKVENPINNYTIVPYIGKYDSIATTYIGAKGKLNVTLWALDYNIPRARQHSLPDVNRMLEAFEYWFGPYPFYEDGYQLVDAPHLGMEHQSAIAYGNAYLNGYHGKDLSHTGWGDKFDFIIVHESGHEWFANNITSNDLADMWIHESFTNYSETLFTEYFYGKEAGQEYCYGIRQNVSNDVPIIGPYGVNKEGSGDMYYKGANMINNIRNTINNDAKFRSILRGLNVKFYHQTVDAKDIENYINSSSGIDFGTTFQQYLTTIQIPELDYYFSPDDGKVYYRYQNCLPGFDMPLVLKNVSSQIKIHPTTNWQNMAVTAKEATLFNPTDIEFRYYLKAVKVKAN